MLPAMQLRKLSDKELAFYREPFKTPQSRGGEPADVYQAQLLYLEWLKRTDMPKLLLYAKPGIVITESLVLWAQENLKNLGVVYIGEGLHFVQEDHPHEIGRALVAWYTAEKD
jgi:haloalkane dehalogenase